jgi:hypothetical protein
LTACLSAEEADEQTSEGSHLQDIEGGPDTEVDPTDTDDPQPTMVAVEPAAVNLGALDPRCSIELDIQLTASGDASPGQLTAQAPEGWTVTVESSELNTGDSTLVHLSWDGSEGDPSGDLTIDFDAVERITVPLMAMPEVPHESLTIELDKRSEADLLLAVDRSCNMDDMTRLEPHWPVLRSRLADAGISLRMASVVEDDGCVLGDSPVLDDAYSDEDFRTALWDQQNWTGEWYTAYSEKLLALSSIALTADCNAELVQGSAPLHVLAFADEPDQSDNEWSVYVDEMAALTDPGVPFTVHGIGSTGDPECWAQIYAGVLDAAEATGGVFLDFCTEDWGAGLTELADGMAEANRRVMLSTLPEVDGELVSLRVDGTELPGWSLSQDPVLLPPETRLSGELELEFRLAPTCAE